ncbi:hypothetical protein ACSBR1_026103 [Camellia fascicularis]
MQVYWSTLFILPKKVVKSIESLFRSFFWSCCELRKYGAKVSWKHVCSSKSEGGLGFKSIEVWNKAAVAKHIWFFFFGGEQSMWCQRVKSYLLKGQSLWRIKMPSDPSWVWRKILSLRPVIYPLILHKIGNGGDVFLWFDNWHPLGSLWARFGARVVYDTAFGMDAKVSRIINNRSWSWPRRRRSFLQELIEHTLLTFTPNSGNDTVIWVPSSDGKFSINSTWNWFRKSFTKVSWEKLLWGLHNIPKASMVTWMAILGRLNTGDRLKLFCISQTSMCVLCNDPYEDHNHLFFDCPFSSRVWESIKGKLNVNWPYRLWPDIVQLVSKTVKGKSLSAVVTRLAFTCTVY